MAEVTVPRLRPFALFCAIELEGCCDSEQVECHYFYDEVTETWGWLAMCFPCALEAFYIFNPEERP